MKKIITLLSILSCLSTYCYDVKKAAQKFSKKHANRIIQPRRTSDTDVYRKAGNEIIDSIALYGLDAIQKNKTQNKNPNPMRCSNNTPLVTAIASGDRALVKFLLQNGANPNEPANYFNRVGEEAIKGYLTIYPIEYAANMEMVQYLEDNGADINPLFQENWINNDIPDIRQYRENKKMTFQQDQPIVGETQ